MEFKRFLIQILLEKGVDSFVHVFRKFSELNCDWKFSPVVRFGASVAL